MKILLVSMNSIHFRRWSDQLRESGHELFWFDILDQGYAPSMDYITQITGWKKGFLRKRGRTFLKNKLPRLYNALVHKYDTPVDIAFAKALQEIQPELVHSFALQMACIPIICIMERNPQLKWIYSSWGTDLFMPEVLSIEPKMLIAVLERVNFLITDCHRDHEIALSYGFKGSFLGVFPGNGGTDFKTCTNEATKKNGILIKAYQDDLGRGDLIAKALLSMKEKLAGVPIYIIGASINRVYLELETWEAVTIFKRTQPLSQAKLFNLFEECFMYVAVSHSDGMPNMLIEAMGHALFPIQSNPGNVMSEIIVDGVNGFLLSTSATKKDITSSIEKAIKNRDALKDQMVITSIHIQEKYNRLRWKTIIAQAYETMAPI
jgi:hypothetical protein